MTTTRDGIVYSMSLRGLGSRQFQVVQLNPDRTWREIAGGHGATDVDAVLDALRLVEGRAGATHAVTEVLKAIRPEGQ